MIKVNNLQKYFNKNKQNEIHVINDISLDFPSSGLVVLLGASGSGKTTLLNVIGGLDKVQSGNIQLNESIINKYNANLWDQIRTQQIGYVFQNYNLLKDMSVFDNIAFVLKMVGLQDKAEIERRVHYVLKAVNMFKYRKRLASQLSGGQQQRVAIARALVKNPNIVIADEPTGNLDSQNTLEVMNILKVISKQKLVVLVTHETNIAKFYGDRIIEIKDGKVEKDYNVQQDEEHSFEFDNLIYLKELNKLSSQSDKIVNLDIYSDDSSELKDLKVKLILKNNTLYLDVDSNINKVRLLQENAGVALVDDFKQTKSREEITNTQFDLAEIEIDESIKVKQKHKSKMSLSIKNLLHLVVKKLSVSSKKSKLMYGAFILSGILMAFASSYLFAALHVSPYDFMMYQDNYITIGKYEEYDDAQNLPDYDTFLQTLYEVDQDATINMYQNGTNLSIWEPRRDSVLYINQGYGSVYSFSGVFDDVASLGSSDLIRGRLPQNDFEFVIDITQANDLLENYANDYGIWSLDSLMQETVRMSLTREFEQTAEMSLVGIVDTGVPVTYLSASMMELLTQQEIYTSSVSYEYNGNEYSYNLNVRNSLPLELIQSENDLLDFSLVAGSLPAENSNQVLLSQSYYDDIFANTYVEVQNFTFPFTLSYEQGDETKELVLSGVYDDYELGLTFFVSQTQNLIKFRYENLRNSDVDYNQIMVLSNNPTAMISKLNESDISSYYNLQEAQDMAQATIVINVLSVASIVVVLLLLNGLGFYFISRSNMMNRIYEVSVYRALGVKKKDVIKLFLLEIAILISITSLLGYILGTIFAAQVQVLFAQFQLESAFFVVNLWSILSGLVVMIGLDVVFGLLPVWSLLRKTPSEIMSKYDI